MKTKRPVLHVRRRTSPYTLYGPFTWFRAKKDGSPFLKEEKTTWRDVNGFLLQTKRYRVIFEFKRRGGVSR
jgi:hypothetical protein